MKLTKEELSNACSGCRLNKQYCDLRSYVEDWKTMCPCSECLLKPVCETVFCSIIDDWYYNEPHTKIKKEITT